MMSVRTVAILSFALLVGLEPAMLTAQSPVSYSAVTEQRLLNPEPHNWLMYRGTFNGWGYSPLEQITPANVKKLVPVWSFSTGVNEGHQAPPLVNNGMMFVTTPQQQIFALNAKTGDLSGNTRRTCRRTCFSSIPRTAAWRSWMTGSISRPSMLT